jgi:hypothetical protein
MPKNELTQNPSNRLAYPDSISPVPRNEYLGALADFLAQSYSPQRTQQMQGVAQFLQVPAVSQTLDRLSYGEPLTTGAGGLGGTTRIRPEALDAAMALAPLYRPAGMAAKGVENAAMATSRAGERLAERVVPQIMERGGMPAQLLGDLSQGSISPLDVWHGTPHKLPYTQNNPLGEFDASKIGTGAGAQARGYGIYSSESPEFADYFAIKKRTPDVEGIAIQNGLKLSRDAQVELMRQSTRDSMGKPTKGDNYIDPIAAARKLQNASIEARQMPSEQLQNTIREFQEQNRAYLYKADLPDEKIAKMLDLDLPIKNQPEALKAIRQMIDDPDILKTFDHNVSKGITGENAALNYVKGRTPAERSENLRKAGIPGNVYKELDTRNFVTFPGEEKSMKILERKVR